MISTQDKLLCLAVVALDLIKVSDLEEPLKDKALQALRRCFDEEFSIVNSVVGSAPEIRAALNTINERK